MRRRKASPPPSLSCSRKRDAEDPIHTGDHVSCCAPPNHMLPPVASELTPYPLLHAEVRTDGGAVPAWVDAKYDYDYLAYADRPKLPPSWMDPELFVRMAKQNAEVKTLLAKAFKRNRRALAVKALLPLLDKVMEEQYMVYLLEHFEQRRTLLAQWLLANHAERQLTREDRERQKKLKRLAR